MLHSLSWNRVPETNTLSMPSSEQHRWKCLSCWNQHRCLLVSKPTKCFVLQKLPKVLATISELCIFAEKIKIHFKSPHLLFLKPALALYLLSTWAYSLINWKKHTDPSDIHKDIGQPIYFGKYTLSHPFLHLTYSSAPTSRNYFCW